MADDLVARMRRARERRITVRGRTYTIRRPTRGELIDMTNFRNLDIARACVVDWDLKASDLYPSGDAEAVPFNRAAWQEWIGDQSEQEWSDIAEAIISDFKEHQAKQDESLKN